LSLSFHPFFLSLSPISLLLLGKACHSPTFAPCNENPHYAASPHPHKDPSYSLDDLVVLSSRRITIITPTTTWVVLLTLKIKFLVISFTDVITRNAAQSEWIRAELVIWTWDARLKVWGIQHLLRRAKGIEIKINKDVSRWALVCTESKIWKEIIRWLEGAIKELKALLCIYDLCLEKSAACFIYKKGLLARVEFHSGILIS
jgi:hypothetical protein